MQFECADGPDERVARVTRSRGKGGNGELGASGWCEGLGVKTR